MQADRHEQGRDGATVDKGGQRAVGQDLSFGHAVYCCFLLLW